MIHHLRGRLVEKYPTHVVLDVNGVGYLVHISVNTYDKLKDEEQCQLLTHYAVNVDVRSGSSNHVLFGFIEQLEKDLFQLLISVSGVSVNTARMIFSTYSPTDIQSAISTENVSVIKAVKGIGPKLAQRVVTELKDKVMMVEGATGEIQSIGGNTNREEALAALLALGFDRVRVLKTMENVLKSNTDMQVEDLIRNCLKQL